MPTCFGVICTVVATTCWETFLMSSTLRQFSCYDCWKEWDAQQTKAIVAIREQHFAKKRKKNPILPSRAVLGGKAKPQEEVPGGELFEPGSHPAAGANIRSNES